MKTALAVVVAVGLIVGALYVRSEFIEGEPPAVADGTEAPAGGGDGGDDAVVACDEVLAGACPEDASHLDLDELLAAFSTRPVDYDVLIAPLAVVELIEESQTSQVRFAEDRDVLATTPLVLTVTTALDEVVGQACGTSVTWACAADLVAARQLSPALVDPRRASEGLVGLAALTGGFFDNPAYASNALSGGDFFTWVDAVDAQVHTTSTPVEQLIQFAGARNDSAVATEVRGLEVVGRAAQNVPDLYWPTPVAHLPVVAVGVDGADVGGLAEDVGQALLDAGWRAPDGAPVGGGPPAPPDDDGLPSGGTLFVLRDRAS